MNDRTLSLYIYGKRKRNTHNELFVFCPTNNLYGRPFRVLLYKLDGEKIWERVEKPVEWRYEDIKTEIKIIRSY